MNLAQLTALQRRLLLRLAYEVQADPERFLLIAEEMIAFWRGVGPPPEMQKVPPELLRRANRVLALRHTAKALLVLLRKG